MTVWQDVPLRRSPTQDRSRDKVARALAAADAIVREQGVTGITLTQVAARAGSRPC
jgi:AcrR family transcriptional regulator